MSAGETRFSFHEAFDRNIGWLTEWEQLALRGKRIAIAGMGGVGGFHLLTLARLGIGSFHIADLDRFEVPNFNRQIGATMQSVGRPKAEVLAEMALDINPEIKIKRFDNGIDDSNIEAFLSGVDLFVDGFDFFVLGIRRKVFGRCGELGIPAVTAAPVGMGVGFLAFTKEGMAFEDYFRFEGYSELRQYVHFLLGVAPAAPHRSYLVDPSRMDFGRKRAPSTVIGCELCASVTATNVVKLLIGRGEVKPAPYHHHYDAYLGKLIITKLRHGNGGLVQRIKARAVERAFTTLIARPSPPPKRVPASQLEEILDSARWAPSGDNAQPWRFQIIDNGTVVVRIKDDSKKNVYEYRDGEPTLISAGMLLESLRIAATAYNRTMTWTYDGHEDGSYKVTARFLLTTGIEADPLHSYLPLRSVNRWPYRTRSLSQQEQEALGAALGDQIQWSLHQSFAERRQMAQLNAAATAIRLRIPETFAVHKAIIDWDRKQSPTGIPAPAIGLDSMTLKIMRWAMHSWARMSKLNRITGTFGPSLQMDYMPGMGSAGFYRMRMQDNPANGNRVEQLLHAGGRIQRFWLTATKLGLAVQPCLATLAFSHYGKTSAPFTTVESARKAAGELAVSLEKVIGGPSEDLIFMCRIGQPKTKGQTSRSTRRSLDELIEAQAGSAEA